MKKKYNPIQLNASGLAHHNIKIDSNYYKKKLYSTNKYLNQSYLNNTSYKNHDSVNISVSLPMSELKSKLLSPKIFRNPTETSVSSSNSRTRITAIKNYNNISIYYSKHKNKRKEKNSKSNLKSGMKYSSKNKENICNNYQNNSKIKIRKIMQIKNANTNTSFNFSFINKRKKIYKNSKNKYENSKNNNSSIERDKKPNIVWKRNNSNFVYSCTCRKDSYDRKKSLKFENNKKIYNEFHKKRFSYFFSPQKPLLKKQNYITQKSQKIFLDNSKKSLQKAIFSKKIEPKIINPKEFKILNKIGFGSFGKIYKVVWNQNNQKYAMKIMYTQNKENILYIKEKTKLIIDFQKKIKCDGLIKIFGYTYIKKGEEYFYYVIMELAERDWEKEITRRKCKMLYYSERELFFIMSKLIKTLSLLQKNHITHRDIKLQNILLINNKFKICDFGEARKLVQKGTIIQPVRGSELYMSPIQFHGLNNNLKLVQHNTYKSDVFSLGMCILFAATLSDNCLYDIRELTNMNVIMEILERYLRKRYSIGFIKLLLLLLEVDERKRPDFIQLENIIYQITKNN
jgi:hypothetical protein